MRTSTRNALAMLLVCGIAAGIGILGDRSVPRRLLVDVLPAETALLVELDLPALRASPWNAAAEGGPLHRALARVRDQCSVDPLQGVERLALAVPGGAGFAQDLAVVATGPGIRASDVGACAQAIVRARGATPRLDHRRGFLTVGAADGPGVVAVRDGGPIVVGSGAWLDAVLQSASGGAPSLRADPLHDVRRAAQTGAVATVTYRLPVYERTQLSAMLPREAGALAQVTAALGALRFESTRLTLEIEADCEQSACVPLAAWIRGARSLLATDPRLKPLGVAPAVETATVDVGGGLVRVQLAVPLATLDALGGALAP